MHTATAEDLGLVFGLALKAGNAHQLAEIESDIRARSENPQTSATLVETIACMAHQSTLLGFRDCADRLYREALSLLPQAPPDVGARVWIELAGRGVLSQVQPQPHPLVEALGPDHPLAQSLVRQLERRPKLSAAFSLLHPPLTPSEQEALREHSVAWNSVLAGLAVVLDASENNPASDRSILRKILVEQEMLAHPLVLALRPRNEWAYALVGLLKSERALAHDLFLEPPLSPVEQAEFRANAAAWSDVLAALIAVFFNRPSSASELLDKIWNLNASSAVTAAKNSRAVQNRVVNAVKTTEVALSNNGFVTLELGFLKSIQCAPLVSLPSEPAEQWLQAQGAHTSAWASPVVIPSQYTVRGRTVFFSDGQGRRLGLKFEKADSDDLISEEKMNRLVQHFHKPLGLLSPYPESLGLIQMTPPAAVRAEIEKQAIYQNAQKFSLAQPAGHPLRALLYVAPQDYHIYLHEAPSWEALQAASRRALFDAGRLSGALGLFFKEPADLFHNRTDAWRPYQWNVDLVGDSVVGYRGGRGAGRLDAWRQAVRCPNLRLSGAADTKRLDFIITQSQFPQTAAYAQRMAIHEHMGNYLLAWTLVVGQWFVDNDAFACHPVSDCIRQGFAAYLAGHTGLSLDECDRRLSEAGPHWERLAGQLQWSLSPRANKGSGIDFVPAPYVADVNAHRIPPELYGPQVLTDVWVPRRGWDEQLGWRLDGVHEDIGPHNGPNPLTELFDALYTTCFLAEAWRTARSLL